MNGVVNKLTCSKGHDSATYADVVAFSRGISAFIRTYESASLGVRNIYKRHLQLLHLSDLSVISQGPSGPETA